LPRRCAGRKGAVALIADCPYNGRPPGKALVTSEREELEAAKKLGPRIERIVVSLLPTRFGNFSIYGTGIQ